MIQAKGKGVEIEERELRMDPVIQKVVRNHYDPEASLKAGHALP